MAKRKYRMEIFENATVQCLHCGRFFIKKLHHKCTGGYRKHHHKWLELTINNDESEDQPKKEPCPNCKETVNPCACMRNICIKCGKPVGNITFTVCDDCWDKEDQPKKIMMTSEEYYGIKPVKK